LSSPRLSTLLELQARKAQLEQEEQVSSMGRLFRLVVRMEGLEVPLVWLEQLEAPEAEATGNRVVVQQGLMVNLAAMVMLKAREQRAQRTANLVVKVAKPTARVVHRARFQRLWSSWSVDNRRRLRPRSSVTQTQLAQ
jgi:hypothetical protein